MLDIDWILHTHWNCHNLKIVCTMNKSYIDWLLYLRSIDTIHFQQSKFQFEKIIHSQCLSFLIQVVLVFLFLLRLPSIYCIFDSIIHISRVTINWQYNPSNQNVNNENRRWKICSLLFFELHAVGVKFSWQHVLILIVHRSPFTIRNRRWMRCHRSFQFIIWLT